MSKLTSTQKLFLRILKIIIPALRAIVHINTVLCCVLIPFIMIIISGGVLGVITAEYNKEGVFIIISLLLSLVGISSLYGMTRFHYDELKELSE